MPQYVEVNIVGPSGEEYTGKVDKDADDETLISDLVHELGLPPDAKYAISIIGSTKIREGVTVQIYVVKPPSVKDIRKK